MQLLYLIVPVAPLVGAVIAGLFGWAIGRRGAHWVTIVGMVICTVASAAVFSDVLNGNVYNGPVYTWLASGNTRFEIGFLIDRLSATMMLVVSFVSLMIHIYTIGYMADDPGYQRFFSYISLFTFSMLMLVMANNFLQLFFGWEAVGLMSYLLIGFWYTRPTAIYASLKAFLVNRVGDFGFLLGIALTLMYFGTLDYAAVFAGARNLAGNMIEIIPGQAWSLMTVICILLFIGAMGKSAQFPLHVWLPDSMEGPTPISALIHAATMVTAGIFMVARMSPLYELSETALSVVMVIGAITALFMALIAIVQNDIKRVVAYSTLSQLGYMTVALGASAYAAGMFHLVTHAFFKALLFLGAGSVIIALHHEQDMRRMGGLRKYMPVTYWTMLIGAISSAGIPGFAGFFSKDAIIEAVHFSKLPGSAFAYFAVLTCVFVTALYTFRLLFMTFHGAERFRELHADHEEHKQVAGHNDHQPGRSHNDHGASHGHVPHESPAVVTVPLIALAIPSIGVGWLIGPVLFGGYFGSAIAVAPGHDVLAEMGKDFNGVVAMILHAFGTAPFWFAVAGIATATYLYLLRPDLPAVIKEKAGVIYTILDRKYWFDEAYSFLFVGGARSVGTGLWKGGDVAVIDGVVNGSAGVVAWFAQVIRKIQSGFIYNYAFAMIFGILVLMTMIFVF
ncbi:MAG: NADH-quinone oxidoreductase subunit L [Betaproteobacteria bacterium RIFCSPLOWO2_12_FULL_62_58]|nr:MAG: NADH-quinone oxidoreductase subunit L [Betaproteobacteria bacterium RIFCSPLOWO2_12_FULL_62_58]